MPYRTIQNVSDLAFFIKADAASSGVQGSVLCWFLSNPIGRFQVLLRTTEFFTNARGIPFRRVIRIPCWLWLNHLRVRLGFTIPLNVFGPGLSVAHFGTIVVNGNARVGENCRIHPGVCIGRLGPHCPSIGDHVYLAPGAKIFGGVRVGDDAAIGANAVVTRDVPAGVTVAGAPARIISTTGARNLVRRGSELLTHPNHSDKFSGEVLES